MEIECFPKLSEEQQRNLPNGYTPPPVEGMYSVTDEHPEGIICVFVGYCDWEKNFEFCLKQFMLTIFHEAMHIIFPELEDYIPYAEKIFASVLSSTRSARANLIVKGSKSSLQNHRERRKTLGNSKLR